MSARTWWAVAGLASAMALGACASSEGTTSDLPQGTAGEEEEETACVPGKQEECACPGDKKGVQVCNAEGSGFEACDCPIFENPPGDDEEPCGDLVCSEDDDEDCHTCPDDCGQCAPCTLAPSCDNAFIPPPDAPHAPAFDVPKMDWVSPEELRARLVEAVLGAGEGMRLVAAALDSRELNDEHPAVTRLRAAFDEHPRAADGLRRQLVAAGMESVSDYRSAFPEQRVAPISTLHPMDVDYPGGTVECGAPLLRIGVSKIKVHEEDDDILNDIVYCVIQAEAATASEVRVTPQTPNLDEGEEHSFALESGVFWGQLEPTTPGGNILVTYDCIEADTNDGYQNLINAIGEAADSLGDVVEGDAGWILEGAGAIAPIVSTGLALDSDDQLFNAQQTIPLESQLELTNGAWWTVRREGTHNFSDWDWELFIKAWGCAEYGEADKLDDEPAE